MMQIHVALRQRGWSRRTRDNHVTCFGFLRDLVSLSFFILVIALRQLPYDGFWRSIRRMACFRARVCLLGVPLLPLAIQGINDLPNPNLGSVKPNAQSIETYIIIKTTASTPTKFCTTLKTTKCPSLCDLGRPPFWKKDGKQPPFWKPLNRHISATVLPILMKFGTVTHNGPYKVTDRYNFEFLKI